MNTLNYLTYILQGAIVTIELTTMGCIIALAVAFIVGLSRLSRHRIFRVLATIFTEFFRGTSIFVQLFWVYYVLPLFGIPLTPFQAGVLGLGLNTGAYASEVVRGAILAVPPEQFEAATAINLTRWQKMTRVILPQAFVLMLPTFGNNAIELLKATSVVSLISLSDMTFNAIVIRDQTKHTALPFFSILVLYYLMSTAIGTAVQNLEAWLTKDLDIRKGRG